MEKIMYTKNSKIDRIRLKDLCQLNEEHHSGKSKLISRRKLNTIVRVTASNLVYAHKHTPHLTLLPVNDPFRLLDVGGIAYVCHQLG